MPAYTTSQDEVVEVKRFLEAGGIFYLSANGSTSNDYGLNYNLLFEVLGIPDRFSVNQKDFNIQVGTTSIPQGSPIVDGPFGRVGTMTHSPFRLIDKVSLDGIAGVWCHHRRNYC